MVFDHPEVEDRQGLFDRIERGAPDVVLLECTNKTDILEGIMAGIRADGAVAVGDRAARFAGSWRAR